jgi:transposase
MIDQDKRKALYSLSTEGMEIREISRRLGVSRNTVKTIINQKGTTSDLPRKDKISLDRELLGRLYDACEGRIQRIHEKLCEEEEIEIGYSTLTSLIREFDLSGSRKLRCAQVPDAPGVEEPHDT